MIEGGPPAEPQTWHYGVIARWWAEFNLTGPEIAFYRGYIERNGQPALDVACGTGRLLIPFLQAGLDVDGCDISEDMLAWCRERAEKEGLAPNLFAQPMHRLNLPRKYRTIVVCGGFGLGGNRAHDVEALRRLYEQLEPGGLLLLDNEVPYNDTRRWPYWLKDERATLPEAWRPPPEERRRAGDGTEFGLRLRTVDMDPLAQRITWQMRAWMWRDGELVAEDEHTLQLTFYFTHEIVLMLEQAGFVDVEMRGDYQEVEPSADSEFVVFLARRPG